MTADIMAQIGMAITGIKSLKELGEKAQYAEVMKGIAHMSVQLSEKTISANELKEENRQLKEEIKKLKEFSEKKMTMKNGAYIDENGTYPYCPNCWNNDKKLSLMSKMPSGMLYFCPNCKYTKK